MDANLQEKSKLTKKDYNKKYYEQKKEKEKDKLYICDICGQEYSYYTKSEHNKTKYHKMALGLKDRNPHLWKDINWNIKF